MWLHIPRKVDRIGIIDFAGTGIVDGYGESDLGINCLVEMCCTSEIAGGF